MSDFHYKLEVSDSEMEAYLTILPEDGGKNRDAADYPSVEEIIRYLKSSGIKYGINQKAVERMVKYRKIGETIQVARGEKPLPGGAGRVEYYFDTGNQSQADRASQEITTSKLDAGQFVYAGQLLARRLPPQRGKQGITVTGRVLDGSVGEETYIRAGRNTYFRDDEERELVAAIDGTVSLQCCALHVDGTKFIDTDVDESTGDISFPGNVIVLRNVADGRSIQAGGNIEVHGDVGDAKLFAGGGVCVRGEFSGTGAGLIRAGEDVQVKKVINQKVEAEGSVRVLNSSQNAHISARHCIMMTYYDGRAVGGTLRAGWSIIVKVLGSKEGSGTIAELRFEENPLQSIDRLTRQRDEFREQISDIDLQVQVLTARAADTGFNSQRAQKIRQLRKRQQKVMKRLDEVGARLDSLVKQKERLGDFGIIQVRSRLFSGSEIIINGVRRVINENLRAVTFRLIGDRIHQDVSKVGVLI